MDKFKYAELVDKHLEIDYLEVQSYEMNIYLVLITIGENSGLVYNEKDKPMRFYSAGHIRETFSQSKVKRAVMKHDSPYDEMIGNPPKASHCTALPFSMTLPY